MRHTPRLLARLIRWNTLFISQPCTRGVSHRSRVREASSAILCCQEVERAQTTRGDGSERVSIAVLVRGRVGTARGESSARDPLATEGGTI